ncbi:hypothetical protein PFISCL1PPCAC_16123, partial [Pristionchus fissidentatus]
SIHDTVSTFLARFTPEPINASSSTVDLGLDSIHLSELEFELQRIYPEARLQHGFTLRLPTIGDVVRHVERATGGIQNDSVIKKLHNIPLSPVQSRVLFLCRLHPELAHQFNERVAFSADSIDLRRLEFAIRRVVMRHAILRTFYEHDRQLALSATECHFAVAASSNEPSEESIDIESGPPIRVHVQRLENEYKIYIDLHHIAVDGRSIGIIL